MATETLLPVSDSAVQWADVLGGDGDGVNWEHVCDANDATFVSSLPAGAPRQDILNLADPVTLYLDQVIDSVQVLFRGMWVSAAGAYIAPVIVENAVTTVGTLQAMSNAWKTYSQTWTLRPSDGGPWTYGDIVALKVGYKDNARPASQARVADIWVIVTYHPGNPVIIVTMGPVPA
jgi:hypothetical protein